MIFHLLHKLKQLFFLQVFTVYLRYLIGGTFVIAAFGMGKVRGTANLIQSMDKPIEQLAPIQQFFQGNGRQWFVLAIYWLEPNYSRSTFNDPKTGAFRGFNILWANTEYFYHHHFLWVQWHACGYRTHAAGCPLFIDLGPASIDAHHQKLISLYTSTIEINGSPFLDDTWVCYA